MFSRVVTATSAGVAMIAIAIAGEQGKQIRGLKDSLAAEQANHAALKKESALLRENFRIVHLELKSAEEALETANKSHGVMTVRLGFAVLGAVSFAGIHALMK